MKKAMKVLSVGLACSLLVALIPNLQANVYAASSYYVATNGSDSQSGSQSNPFKTIQKCANVAQAGDTCLIREGTYRETVTPGASGSSSNPITFTAFEDESVIISGADVVSGGWSGYSGTIYETSTMNWDLGLGHNQIFVDGVMVNEARWPNMSTSDSPSHPNLATVDSGSASGSGSSASGTVNDSSLGSGYTGAKINIAPSHGWLMQTGTVTSSSSGTLDFDYNQWSSYFVPDTGQPYFLWGKLSLLDSANEAFYDSSSDKLYLWTSAGDNPSNHVVEAKKRQYAFDLSGRSYIHIEGVNLFAAALNTDGSSQNIMIDNIFAEYISHDLNISDNPWISGLTDTGFQIHGSNHTIQNSEIAYSSGNGVVLQGSDHLINNNIIRDVAYAGAEAAVHTGFNGVTPLSSGHQILNNSLYNSGRSVLMHRNSENVDIMYNEIYNAGLQVFDQGLTYTWGTNGNGTEIAYNLIYDNQSSGYNVGIYLDNDSSGYVVHHNVVWNTTAALQMNADSQNNLIYNNTLDGDQYSVYNHFSGDLSGSKLTNNIYTNSVSGIPSTVTQQTNLDSSTNPQFEDAASGNYQLQSSSPAIDAGTVISPYTDGYVGSDPDIGAYEYGVTPWTVGATGGSGGSGGTSIDAQSTIQAESYDDMSGISNYGDSIGNFDGGDWIKFENVDFANGMSTFTANVGVDSTYAGQDIEVRLGSTTGTLIGTLTVQSTGGFGIFDEQTISITETSGIQDIYLVGNGSGGIANIDWITFDGPVAPADPVHREAESYDDMSGIADYGSNVGGIDNGDWLKYSAIPFGTGLSSFTANIGVDSTYAGQDIEVRLGSVTGTLLGTLTVQSTGGFGTFVEQTISITETSGTQDIFLVGKGTGGIGNIDWISFDGPVAPADPVHREAESYNNMSGISNNGTNIGSFDDGDWLEYSAIPFDTGLSSFTANVGVDSTYAGQDIEVRLGSTTGTLVGTLTVQSTGGFGTFVEQTISITETSGTQDIFLVGKGSGGIGNIDWISFQ